MRIFIDYCLYCKWQIFVFVRKICSSFKFAFSLVRTSGSCFCNMLRLRVHNELKSFSEIAFLFWYSFVLTTYLWRQDNLRSANFRTLNSTLLSGSKNYCREPKFQVLGFVLLKLFYLFNSFIHTEEIYFENVRMLLQKLFHRIVQEAAKNRPSFASKNEKDRISVIVKYIFKAR